MSDITSTHTLLGTQIAATLAENADLRLRVTTLINALSLAKDAATLDAQTITRLSTEVAALKAAQKPTTRGSSGTLTTIVIDKPIRGDVDWKDVRIVAAPGLTRMFDPSPGVTQKFTNCEFDSDARAVPSAVEETTVFKPGQAPYRLILQNVTFERRERYGLFFDARIQQADGTIVAPTDILIFVEVYDSLIDTSDGETPARFMQGVSVKSRRNLYRDTADIGSDKANGAVRWHCPQIDSEDDEVTGSVKYGFVHARVPSAGRIVNLTAKGKGIWPEGDTKGVQVSGVTWNGQPWKPQGN